MKELYMSILDLRVLAGVVRDPDLQFVIEEGLDQAQALRETDPEEAKRIVDDARRLLEKLGHIS